MSKVVLVTRILLGVVFVFFGLNSILQFINLPLPPGDAGVFLVILTAQLGVMAVEVLLRVVLQRIEVDGGRHG